MSILDRIIGRKRERIEAARRAVPLAELLARIGDAEPPRPFMDAVTRRGPGAMRTGPLRLIAECKRASPSSGIIRADFDPAALARIYETRASAISVLTEEDFFQGSLAFIAIVKGASSLPVLRKDFIVDEYQVYESRAHGADALLLIDAALDGAQPEEYLHLARELGMGVLYEVHDRRELDRALGIGAPIIGINNRNLQTLAVDIETTFALARDVPPMVTLVSESGISHRSDAVRLEEAGVDAMLVGTAFMEARDIAAAVDALIGRADG
jgi:indole-3-glycerol phosphate synthase